MSGRFIVIDGIEGAGKSTQLPVIADWIGQRHGEPLMTREPGGTPLAERIRSLVLADHEEPMPQMAELLMMFASRALHLHNKVLPALQSGQWVLCDRFVDSSFAYQAAGQGLDPAQVQWLESAVVGNRTPDCTLIFDLPTEQVIDRIRQRAHADRFDRADQAFLGRVREAFLERAAAAPDRYVVVDATQSIEQVSTCVIRELEARFAIA